MKIKLFIIILFLSFLFPQNTCIETKQYNYMRNKDMSEDAVWNILRDKATKEFFKDNFTFYFDRTTRDQVEEGDYYQDDYSSYQSFVSAGQIKIKRLEDKSYIENINHYAIFEICYNEEEINAEIQKRILSEEENKVLAIVAFVSEGLSSTERSFFKDKLEQAIMEISPYDLLSSQKVDQILRTTGKITTEACNEAACAVDLGRDLNVDLVLQPNVIFNKDEESTLGFTLYNVESGVVAAKLFEFVEVSSFNKLLKVLDKYVMDIIIDATGGYSSLSTTQQGTTSASFNNGFIRINTKPQGASIIVDGVSHGKTSKLIKDVAPGEHTVVLSLPEYNRLIKKIIVSPGQTAVINEMLIKEMGSLFITSEPKGAQIYLNGNLKGSTFNDLDINYIETGDYRLTASYPDYEEYVQTVSVEFNATNTINIKLDPLPEKVRFFSTPSNAEIYLDGELIGKTDSEGYLKEFSFGTYTVVMKYKNYLDEETTFTTTPGGSSTVDLSLRKLPKGQSENKNMGFVSAKIYPDETIIKIDNKQIDLKYLDYYQLLNGNHSLKVSRQGFRSYTTDFEVLSQKHNNTIGSINLEPLNLDVARKRSYAFPGVGHLYAEQKSEGIGWLVGGALSFLLVQSSMMDYNDKDDIYNQAFDAYSSNTDANAFSGLTAEVESAFDDRKKSMNMLLGSVTALASIWLGSALDFKATINEYNKIQAMVKLNVKF